MRELHSLQPAALSSGGARQGTWKRRILSRRAGEAHSSELQCWHPPGQNAKLHTESQAKPACLQDWIKGLEQKGCRSQGVRGAISILFLFSLSRCTWLAQPSLLFYGPHMASEKGFPPAGGEQAG